MGSPAHVVGSASSQGSMIHLSDTSLTLLHQASQQTGVFDRIEVYATNVHATDTEHIDIFWGADTAPNCKIPVDVIANTGPVTIVPGWPLERGLTVKAQATVGATFNITTIVTPISSYQ
jgi:hypothetical protein